MNAQLYYCLAFIFGICTLPIVKANLKVIYAVNAGSHEHTDEHGVHYQSDPLKIGTASDYGNHLMMIGRVPQSDEILYRTERYHTATFGYDLPIQGDGDYALILKFCEVYFNEPNMKVFDVTLNKLHTIVSGLDIFRHVGRGTAHDEYVFFRVTDGRLYYDGAESDIYNGMMRLEFVKGNYDNPKINAFALLKGNVADIPRLVPLNDDSGSQEEKRMSMDVDADGATEMLQSLSAADRKVAEIIPTSHTDMNLEESGDLDTRSRKTSGPRQPSPYIATEGDSSSIMLPVFIAIGAFIPLLFCLCKL